MAKAIRIHHNGGPEVLKWEVHEPGQSGNDEVLVRHEAIGLNFISNFIIRHSFFIIRYS